MIADLPEYAAPHMARVRPLDTTLIKAAGTGYQVFESLVASTILTIIRSRQRPLP
jgi:hypothetical protein